MNALAVEVAPNTAPLAALPNFTIALTDAKGRPVAVKQRGRRQSILTLRPDGTHGTRRPRTNEEREMVADTEQARMIVSSPDFWNVAHALPGNARVEGANGRPNDYPTWVLLLHVTLATLNGSQRGAIRMMSDPLQWQILRAVAHHYLPPGFDEASEQAPARHHLSYFVKKWRSDAYRQHRENADKAFRGTALRLAKSLGHLGDSTPFRYNQPDPTQWVSFDGTVYPAPSNKRRTSKHPNRRQDSGSGWHNKFGDDNERVWGTKIVFASMRSEDWWGRVILAQEHVVGATTKSGIGDEGEVTTQLARELKEAAPGMRGIIVDGVLRDKHITPLSRLNIHTVNYPTAASNPDRGTKGTHNDTRVEKKRKLGVYRHTRPDGRQCGHHLWADGTVIKEKQLVGNGTDSEHVLVELPIRTVETRRNSDRTYRHNLIVEIPCAYGDFETRVALHHRGPNDPAFKRGEVLRFYPIGSPQFGVLYGRRNDTESLHAHIKKPMPRMPAYGAEAQSLFALGYAIRNNAVLRQLALREQPPPQ